MMMSRSPDSNPGKAWMIAMGWLLLAPSVALMQVAMATPGADDPNLVPNALFLGQAGAVDGVVGGSVPTAWRAFAIGGGDVSLELVELAADTLFPGSPPTSAVRLSVNTFGADQGFDHFTHVFSLDQGRNYRPSVWVRSGNADSSDQGLQVNMPLFDADMNFTGRDPASFTTQGGHEWTQVSSATDATAEPGEAFAHIAFRLVDEGDENSILIALPEVIGRPVTNLVPNPGLFGSSGVAIGNISGPVPDAWRAFAVGEDSLSLTATELAGDALFPGSPPTRSIRMAVSGSAASTEGLDFELNLAALTAGYRHWGEIWIRSGHGGMQSVSIALPLYDDQGAFLGIQPGSAEVAASEQWQLFAGPAFTAASNQQVNLAIRLIASGGEDSVEIALPRIVGPADTLFADRFQQPLGTTPAAR
ncbi:MAG: hypothetical protein LAT56_00855 [Wenzhouxiangella sp.]|nr:hypothetical protein [Wenzhouxiangella sp.]